MNTALLIAPQYPELEPLRRELSGLVQLYHAAGAVQGLELLKELQVTALALEWTGREEDRRLLDWLAAHRPEAECVVMVDPERFCAVQTTGRSLRRLMKPVRRDELAECILRLVRDAEQAAQAQRAGDVRFLRRQEGQAWARLLSDGGAVMDPRLRDRTVLPVLLHLRRWRREFTPGEKRERRQGVRILARRALLQRWAGCMLPQEQDGIIVLLYGPDAPDEDAVRTACAEVSAAAARCFDCDTACYFGTLCPAGAFPAQLAKLIEGDRDNVSDVRAVRSLEQLSGGREALSLPVLRDWMPYFIDGQLEKFCRCIRDHFSQAMAANSMDRKFLARFQQDFIQEIGFAMKNAGVPLHELFSEPDDLLRMTQAVRYVPDMLDWVRRTAGRAIGLTRPEGSGHSIARRVCDYIDHRLVYPLQREELSRTLQLSEGHIAREFRREMGMSIAQYQNRQRIELACVTIRRTRMPLAQVAEQCGFHDYPYFFKTFKRLVGMSPTEYQIKMQDLDM